MSKRGVVTEVQVDEQGSELVADLAVSDVTVYVESAEDYDTDGGTLEINDVRMDYTTTDLDLDTITLTAPSTVAGALGDRVRVISGGEVAYDFVLLYSDSDTDAAAIPIPFEKRALWAEGPVDPSIPVEVSDDLSEVLDVPGRPPVVNPYATQNPMFIGHLGVDQPIPDGIAYTTVLSWDVTELRGGMTYDALFGQVYVPLDGYYSVSDSTVTWDDGVTVGRRAGRPMFSTYGGDVAGSLSTSDSSSAGIRTQTRLASAPRRLMAGESVRLQVSQTSGGSLNLVGDSGGVLSFFCVEYRGPL